jgi:excisionase family DNA binding protein
MRAIYLLRRPFDSPAAQKRGFSNCTGGKEELELRMRNALHPSETSRATTKSNKLVDSTSLGRPPVVPMKCAAPVSPSSVRPLPELFSEGRDDLPWNVSRAAQFLGVSPQTVYVWVERKQIPHFRIMGRNIRFLRADLERFRMSSRQEPEESHNR